MRKKVRKIIKERAVSVLLSLAMFVTSVPVQTFAQDKPQDIFRIAENGMTQDILDSDVFYTCFLSNIRRSPLRLRWTVPPFLRL